nr:type IV toxin-antitoxin system AbiEi family antitoxin domain-containing protein [Pseudomonadota bacterium]
MASGTQSKRILNLAKRKTLVSAVDVREHGWSSQMLIKLHKDGKLERVTRGLYALPGAQPTTHRSLAEVCRRVPKGVVCLLSALQFHEIGTQLPHEVWVAVPEGTQTPPIDYPPLRIVRLRG